MDTSFRYVDVHCHPNLGELSLEQESVIGDMREKGVLGVVVGVDLQSSREAARLAAQHEHLWACVGLHPNYTQKEEFDAGAFSGLLQQDKVVGLGECGIDYFRQSTTAPGEEVDEGWKEKQWDVFKAQVALAVEQNVPLMIHCRPSKNSMDAYEEVADYFEQLVQYPDIAQKDFAQGGRLRGNMHFFVGNLAVARRFWALGFTTSFTGVVTFAREYDEVVREAPLDMILTETDAPYAAPAPHRGKRNEPAYVSYVTEEIARIRGVQVAEVQDAVLVNAKRLFGVAVEPRDAIA